MSSVLLFDVCDAACISLSTLLESAGHTVVVAADGSAAIGLALTAEPSLALIGLSPPGLDGIEFARRLRTHPELSHLAVVLLSHGRVDSDTHVASLEAGADACFEFPMPPRELLARVDNVLRRQHSSEALRRSEKRQRCLIEQMADGVLVVAADEGGAILFANSECCRMLDRAATELVGLPFGHTLQVDTPVEVELLRNGSLPRLVQMRTIAFEWDRQPAWLVSLHDVSELHEAARQLRDRQQRYRSLFDHHPDSVFLLDTEGRIIEVNAAFLELTGWSEQQALLSHFQPTVAPEMYAFTQAQFARVLAGEPVRYETVAMHRDGRRIPVEVTNLPMVVDDKISGIYGIAHDVSRRQGAESELRRNRTLLDIAGRTANVGGWSFDVESAQMTWSERVALIYEVPLGYSPDLDRMIAFAAPQWRDDFREALRGCMQDGAGFDKELEIVTARSERRWVRAIGEPMTDRSGRIIRIHGAIQEISDRKAAEQSTRELAERLETTLESIDAACITVDREWRLIYLNSRAGELLRHDRQTLHGKCLWDVLPPWAATEIEQRCRRAMQDRATVSFETCLAARQVWLGVTVYPAGEGLAMFLRDVTAQRRDAQRMRLLEACIGRSNDIVLICEADPLDEPGPRTVYVNPAFERTTGYSPAEILGRSPRLLQGEQTDRQALGRIRTALARGEPVREELINHRKDGRPIWLELDIAPVADESGAFTHWIAIHRDIGGRKAAEQSAAESLARFRLLAEASLDAIGEWNLVTGELWWSEGYLRLFGRMPDVTDPQIDSWSRYVHPDDRSHVLAALKAFTEGADDKSSIEYRYAHADGRWLNVLVRVQMIRDAQGQPIRMVGGMTDMSEVYGAQRRLESQLARMETMQRITHAIGERDDLDSIFRVVCDRLVVQMPATFVAVGEHGAEVGSVRIRHLATPEATAAAGACLADAINAGRPTGCIERALGGELVVVTDSSGADADSLGCFAEAGQLSVMVAPLQVESHVFGVLIVARDEAEAFSSPDSEFLRQLSGHVALAAHQAQLHRALQSAYDRLRHTQQAVLQQERLRGLGEMASGIAHDINNAVSPVALYAEAMLEGEKGLTPRGRERMAVILRAIEDVARTVARLREFYRPQDDKVLQRPMDLEVLVEQVIELTRARWRDMPQRAGIAIEIVREFAPSLPNVAVVDGDVREALTNLVFNAVDAMWGGGFLTVRTFIDPAAIDGGRVVLEVEDTGIGMDEWTLKQCMEPFFTTKGERGTGLGLAMVYGTMQRHGGEVEIISSPDKGTRVRLHFPVRGGATDAVPAEQRRQGQLRSLRILVVDDEPLILRSMSDMLRDDGHQVETASGGAAAIERLQAVGPLPGFDMIITDCGMPHVDGLKVARAAKMIGPAPVIMLTGWGQRMNEDGEQPEYVDRVLAKPPRLAELRAVLGEMSASR